MTQPNPSPTPDADRSDERDASETETMQAFDQAVTDAERARDVNSRVPAGVDASIENPGSVKNGFENHSVAAAVTDDSADPPFSSNPLSSDPLSTEQLLDEHHDAVYRFAYRLSGCGAAAEDITQEVFIRAFRSLHQLRSVQAARGWLLVIARNEFSRWCKKFASPAAPPIESAEEDLSEPAQEVLDRQEWVQRALEELPHDFRVVLMMFYFEQLSYAEMAEQLGIPIGTVMSRLNRGRSHLKTVLDQLDEPNEVAPKN